MYNLKYQFGIDDTIETFEIGSHTSLSILDKKLKYKSDVDELNYNDLFKTNVLTGWITNAIDNETVDECFAGETNDEQQFPMIMEQIKRWGFK